jgi:hypothetical protein
MMAETILPQDGDVFYAGDTIQMSFDITEGDNPLDLTPFEITFTMKLKESDADNDFTTIQKVLGDGIEVVDALNGEIVITLSPSDTTGVRTTTTYFYDIQLSDGTDAFTADKGTITITGDITQI